MKIRLLDLSYALHSEVDRPDAEATFRMALWPPLFTMALYLGVASGPIWLLGLVLPSVLAVQWLALRRKATDALLTAIAAKPEALGMLIAGTYRRGQQPPLPHEPGGERAPTSPVAPAADGAAARETDTSRTDEAEDGSATDTAGGDSTTEPAEDRSVTDG